MGRATLGSRGSTSSSIDMSGTSNLETGRWDLGGMIAGAFRWIAKALGFEINPSALFSGLLTSIEALKAIDWNATDEELRALAKQQEITMASVWGGAAGQAFGRLAGIGVARGAAIKLPVLSGTDVGREIAKRMIDDVNEEAIDEVRDEFLNAMRTTAKGAVNIGLINIYINTRTLIKAQPQWVLEGMVGKETASWIKNGWGAENAPVLSFNAFMDEKIEKIKNPITQAFVEEFLEEAWDAFIETGFIITRHLDEAYIQAELNRLQNQGINRTINLIPDENAPDEVFVLEPAPQEEVIQQATGLLNQYRTLRNRSVGTIVGQTANEAFRAMPQLRRLTIEFRPKAKPPWILADGTNAYPHHVRIPNPKLGLTRNQIIHAAKPFTFGNFSATVLFTDRRKLTIYCSTATEAQTRAEELAELSASKILKITSSQVFKVDKNLRREPLPMYAVSARLMFRQNLKGTEDLEVVTSETVKTDYLEMSLWTDDPLPGEPSSF